MREISKIAILELSENLEFLLLLFSLNLLRYIYMSLQRVFEAARKMGSPVIVTDVGGRDPLVVVPLEQFEALTAKRGGVDGRHASVIEKKMKRAEQVDLEQIQIDEDGEDELEAVVSEIAARGGLADLEQTTARTSSAPEMADLASISVEGEGDLTVEERFYLEPVEDKEEA